MSDYSNVTLAGNLGKDAAVKTAQSGQPVVTFSVAVQPRKDQEPEWIPCVFFGERAAKVAPYLTKGLRLLVEGRWQTRAWQDNAGPHSRTEVVVSDVAFNGYNRATVLGRLAADAELVYSGDGKPRLTFRLAVNTGAGDYQRVEWVAGVLFGTRAESLTEYMTKGSKVLVTGEWRTSEWQNDAGETRRKTELVVAPYHGDVVLMGRPRQEAADDAEATGEEELLDVEF